MSFDWSEFLSLSEYMNDNASQFPNEEACYRTVVSRAYYATYCLSRNLCESKDGFLPSGNAHKDLQDYLLNHRDNNRQRLGQRLRRLHQDRKKVDYDNDLGRELPVNKASKALTQAKKIMGDLDLLSV